MVTASEATFGEGVVTWVAGCWILEGSGFATPRCDGDKGGNLRAAMSGFTADHNLPGLAKSQPLRVQSANACRSMRSAIGSKWLAASPRYDSHDATTQVLSRG